MIQSLFKLLGQSASLLLLSGGPPSLRVTAALLVVVNLLPILGVALYGWNPFDLIWLYWYETIFLGLLNLGTIAIYYLRHSSLPRALAIAATLGTGLFFCLHYGMFNFVHGIFLAVMESVGAAVTAPDGMEREPFEGLFFEMVDEAAGDPSSPFYLFPFFALLPYSLQRLGLSPELWSIAYATLLPTLLLLSGSHLVAWLQHGVREGGIGQLELKDLMNRPYRRVVLLHLFILLGLTAYIALIYRFGPDANTLLAILWICAKTGSDLALFQLDMRRAHLSGAAPP